MRRARARLDGWLRGSRLCLLASSFWRRAIYPQEPRYVSRRRTRPLERRGFRCGVRAKKLRDWHWSARALLPAARQSRDADGAMDREEAARLAPPPTKQGWLHKKGGTALSAERKRWFVLQGAGAEATLRYSKEVHGGHRGTIRCEQIRGVVQDENALDIYTPDRTYHVRASSEQSAGQWATVIRCAAAGAEEVESSSDEEDSTGIPWMIDGAIAASRRVVVSSLC